MIFIHYIVKLKFQTGHSGNLRKVILIAGEPYQTNFPPTFNIETREEEEWIKCLGKNSWVEILDDSSLDPKYSSAFAIIVIIVGIHLILTSLYYFKNSRNKLLEIFSIRKNFSSLFGRKSGGFMTQLAGFEGITVILFCMGYVCDFLINQNILFDRPTENPVLASQALATDPILQLGLTSDLMIDSFLVINGLLLVLNFFKKLSRENNKIKICLKMAVYQYLRYEVVLMLIIFFFFGFYGRAGHGPLGLWGNDHPFKACST